MKVCKNLKELEQELKKQLNATLQDDVVKAVKETEQEHVYSDVYAVYQYHQIPDILKWPKIYERRGEHGGLADEKNMIVEAGDLRVSVDNKTEFNERYGTAQSGNELEYLVEDGNFSHGYQYLYQEADGSRGYFRPPRPFIHNTAEELRKGKLREAMINGLAKRGIRAE